MEMCVGVGGGGTYSTGGLALETCLGGSETGGSNGE